MGMLDRYKKAGGILDLVKLVEDSGEPKRSQLLNMIRSEDPDFAVKVEARVLSWEKIRSLPDGAFAEVIGASAPKFIALALFDETPEFVAMAEKCLDSLYNEYKQEKENLKASPPNQSQIEGARRKMIAEARKLEHEGKLKFSVSDAPSAAQESTLNSGSSASSSAQKLSPVSSVISGGGATAKADDGCPPVDSFKLELPPPGLSGERLETYLKSMLGS